MTQFRFEALTASHDRTTFSCGVAALDTYLRHQASQDVRNRVAVVRLLVDTTNGAVAGFYTLSATSLRLTSLPQALQKRPPRFPYLPAILVGRLAIDTRYQGQGIGGLVLYDALRRAHAISQDLGVMAVVVDAKDERACRFYERYGFLRFSDDDQRLFLPMRRIALLLEDSAISESGR